MENQSSSAIDKVLGVLDDMQNVGIAEKYAIGGAFAAILYNEPISPIFSPGRDRK